MKPAAPGPSSVSCLEWGHDCGGGLASRTRFPWSRHKPSSIAVVIRSSAVSSTYLPIAEIGECHLVGRGTVAIFRRCVLDSVLDVQPFSPTFEAFLSDRINLNIMIGKSMFQGL